MEGYGAMLTAGMLFNALSVSQQQDILNFLRSL